MSCKIVFFLLMQSSCPRQLFAVLSPERRVEGREEKAPVLDLLPLQSKDEGRGEQEKRKGSFLTWRIGLKIFESNSFWGSKKKEGDWLTKPLGGFFYASSHPCFYSPSVSLAACLFSLHCLSFSLCPFWNLPLFSSSPARGPWELPRMPLSLSALLPMRLYWWCTSERKRKAEIEEKAVSEW